jgi:hypothetical protein
LIELSHDTILPTVKVRVSSVRQTLDFFSQCEDSHHAESPIYIDFAIRQSTDQLIRVPSLPSVPLCVLCALCGKKYFSRILCMDGRRGPNADDCRTVKIRVSSVFRPWLKISSVDWFRLRRAG